MISAYDKISATNSISLFYSYDHLFNAVTLSLIFFLNEITNNGILADHWDEVYDQIQSKWNSLSRKKTNPKSTVCLSKFCPCLSVVSSELTCHMTRSMWHMLEFHEGREAWLKYSAMNVKFLISNGSCEPTKKPQFQYIQRKIYIVADVLCLLCVWRAQQNRLSCENVDSTYLPPFQSMNSFVQSMLPQFTHLFKWGAGCPPTL